MKWVRVGTIVLLAVFLVCFAGASSSDGLDKSNATSELKVALLDAGPIGDHGYTYEGHMSAVKMAKKLPYVNLSERENAAGPNASQIMREYADNGYKVIFCHGEEFKSAVKEVALGHPETIFLLQTDVDTENFTSNVGAYVVEPHEGLYLMGLVAGNMTKTDKIGFINAAPGFETMGYADAFARGVASVNPEAKVYMDWTGSWYDPDKEKQAALSLIDEGCDVITHATDSDAVGDAAEETGTYYLSFGSDTARFFPHVFLTGMVWNWEPVMTDIVESVHSGAWASRPTHKWIYGMAEVGAELAPLSKLVPGDVRALVEARQREIIQGDLAVFPGMSHEEMEKIDYLEPNIVGETPKL
jgi:basic membrane protein A and related proteins